MKGKKIWIGLVIMCLTLMILTPTESRAAELASGTCGPELTWVLSDDGTLTISGTGSMDGFVSSSKQPWYDNASSIARLIIEDGVTSIGSYTFHSCARLESIEIPDSVTSIGEGAFSYCMGLTSIMIPGSISNIGDDAFSFCQYLANVVIADGVTSIGNRAFNYCSLLNKVEIPNSVTSIGDGAFSLCEALSDIEIPDGVTSIGEEAFTYCTKLESITIPGSVTYIGVGVFRGAELETVYYQGTEEQWNAISGSDEITCPVVFNAVPDGARHVLDNGDLRELLGRDSVRDGDTIVLNGTCFVNDIASDAAPWVIDKAVTICGGTIDLRAGGILLGADVTFDGVTFAFGNRIRNAIMANGYTLTLKDTMQETGARDVHLFCGGLTGHTVTAAAGDHGEIIIQGITSLGNLYAGSLSSDGNANCWAKPSTITVDASASGSMGQLYGCGAIETPIPDNEMLNPGYVVVPPVASSELYPVSGAVTVNLYQTAILAVDGKTGGSADAAVVYNGTGYICTPVLTNIGSLSVETGNLQPVSGSSLSDGASVAVDCGACVGLTGFGNALNIVNFYGGGELVLGESQTLTITGGVSGSTDVGIGGIFNGASTGEIDNKHIYISAENSTDSSFVLLPAESNSEAVFQRDEDGDWTVPSAELDSIVVASLSIPSELMLDTGITDVRIPATVEYGSDFWISYLSLVPVRITINGIEAEMTEDEYTGYEYTIPEESGMLIFGFLPDDNDENVENLLLYGTGDGGVIPDGDYQITLVIPAAYMEDGEELTLTTVLTVGEGEPVDPNVIASGFCGADEDGRNLTWVLTRDGMLTISGTGAMDDYMVFTSGRTPPWDDYAARINGVTVTEGVTSIGDYAFYDYAKLRTVVLADDVTTIGTYAFSGCTTLSGITLSENLLSIGSSAFAGCDALTGITLPDSIVDIGAGAFAYSVSLTEIVLPSGITTIAGELFSGCSKLASVAIPEGVTFIGNSAFYGCAALTTVDLPAALTSIGNSAFSGCTGLVEIPLPDHLTSIGDAAFRNCAGLTEVLLPGGLVTIGNGAFQRCTGLSGITLPSGLTTIGSNAFAGCTGFTTITIPASITSIGASPFNGCTRLSSISLGGENTKYKTEDGLLIDRRQAMLVQYPCGKSGSSYVIPGSIQKIGSSAFSGCTNLASVTIPSGVTEIHSNAFEKCINLSGIILPASVTSIGSNAFSGCTGLRTFAVGDNVESMGSSVFSGCTSLASVTIGNRVPYIDTNTFYGCTSLTEVTLGNSITSIGERAFSGCLRLTTVHFNGSEEEWAEITVGNENDPLLNAEFTYNDDDASVVDSGTCGDALTWSLNYDGTFTFSGTGAMYDYADEESVPWYSYRANIDTIVFSDGMTSIGSYAFYDCDGLSSITIGGSIASVGNYAFSSCSNTTRLTIDSSVTSIGDSAFHACSSLSTVTLSDSVESIGEDAFRYCCALTSIELPCGLEQISLGTFDGCTGLRSVTLPEGLKVLGLWAFGNCGNLAGITLPESLETIGSQAFEGCSSLTAVVIPAGVTAIQSGAFAKCVNLTDIRVHEDNKNFIVVDGVLFDSTQTRLIHYPIGCTNTDYTVPDSVTHIASSAFYGCTALTNITIGKNVEEIGSSAFYGCSNLASISIGTGVKKIGSGAFGGCSALDEVFYSGSKEEWGDIKIENGNTSLTNASFTYGRETPLPVVSGTCGDSLTWQLERSGLLTISGTGAIPDYASETEVPWYDHRYSITSVAVPEGVTGIGSYTFYGLEMLTDIVLPDSVERIGDYAFSQCRMLKSVTLGSRVTDIGEYVFYYTYLKTINLPNSLTRIGAYAFDATMLETIYYDGTVEDWVAVQIGKGDLLHLSLFDITFSEESEAIKDCGICGENVVWYLTTENVLVVRGTGPMEDYSVSAPWQNYCNDIQGVRIMPGVTHVGVYAFWNYEKIAWVDLGTVTSIGHLAFTSCPSLTSIQLPDSVTSIGASAFSDCDNLSNVTLGKNIATIEQFAFQRNPKLTTIDLPGSLTTIGASAFYSSGLTSISIPDSVTSLGNQAFMSCTNLTSVKLPSGLTTIGQWMFSGCTQLKTITIPDSVAFIDSRAFSNTALTSVNIPDSVVSVHQLAFEGCTQLKTVYIPNSVVCFGPGAFKGCTRLSTVYYSGSQDQWNSIDFKADSDILRNARIIFAVESTLDAPAVKVSVDAVTGKPVVMWDAVDGAESYTVYRTTSIYGGYAKVASITGTSFTDSNAVPGETCYYKIAAVSGELIGEFSPVVSAVCGQVVPTTKLTIHAATGKPVLTWNAVEGAERYKVYRAMSKTGTYNEVVSTTETSFTDSNAVPGKTYYYKVAVVSGDVVGELSTYKYITCDCAAPVTKLSNNTSSGKPTLSWGAVEGAKSYTVYRATSKNGTYSEVKSTTGTSYVDSNAVPGKTYYYKVKADNANKYGHSVLSSYKYITCDCAAPVTKLSNNTSSGKPTLSWGAVEGAKSYTVYRATSKNGTYSEVKSTTDTSYVDSNAVPGKTYYYKVKADNANKYGHSVLSSYKYITCDCAAPVTKLFNNTSSGKPTLSWGAVEGAKSYTVYRATSKNGTYSEVKSTAGTSYVDSNAVPGKTYYYKVKANNANKYGHSVLSSYKYITCDCASPTLSISLNSSGKPRLTWKAVDGAVKYEVYRSVSKNGTYTKMFTTENLSYTNTNAVSDVTYYYKVKTICSNSYGNSAFSAIVSVKTG